MENDLISRKKLIDDLEAWRKILDRRVSRFDDMVIHTLPVVFDLVNEQKAVKAEHVRHGRWEDGAFENTKRCSVCKMYSAKVYRSSEPTFDYEYCPYCGAKMDGGAEV